MRLKLKGHCIYGDYCGMSPDGKIIKFWDEETGEILLYPRNKVELASHEKGS